MSEEPRQSSIEVVNGVPTLRRVSATQIKSFLSCHRKWWYDKAAHLPKKPQGRGAALGHAAHQRIERWALHGSDVRGPLERAGDALIAPFAPHFPANGGAVEIEASIESPPLRTPGGVVFVGFVDLVLPPALAARPEFQQIELGVMLPPARRAWIVDHKFKKDLERYADSKADLETDPQAIIYSRWALERWPDLDAILFAHHNHQTQGRRWAFRQWVDLSADHVRDRFVDLCALIDGPMQAAARSLVDLEVSHNEDSCTAFGGCDFALTCPHSPTKKFQTQILGESASPGIVLSLAEESPTDMSVFDALRNRAASVPGTAPAAPPPAAPPPAPLPPAPAAPPAAPPPAPVAPPAIGVQMAASQARVGNLYLTPGGPVGRCEAVVSNAVFFSGTNGPIQVPATATVTDVTNDPQARAVFGLPPLENAGPISSAPVAPPAPPAPRVDQVRPPDAAPALAAPPAPAAAPPAPAAAPAAPAPAAPAEAPKRGRGRPRKFKIDEQIDQQAAGTASATAPMQAAAPASEAEADTEGMRILVVGGSVTGGNAHDLDLWASNLAAKIAESAGAPEIRFAPKDSPLAFGAWRGALAAAAREASGDLGAGIFTISRGDLNDAVIEGLITTMDAIVRVR